MHKWIHKEVGKHRTTQESRTRSWKDEKRGKLLTTWGTDTVVGENTNTVLSEGKEKTNPRAANPRAKPGASVNSKNSSFIGARAGEDYYCRSRSSRGNFLHKHPFLQNQIIWRWLLYSKSMTQKFIFYIANISNDFSVFEHSYPT